MARTWIEAAVRLERTLGIDEHREGQADQVEPMLAPAPWRASDP